MDKKKDHWEHIYGTKTTDQLSWSQNSPSPSLEWILELVPDKNAAIIDAGGGNSPLVDHLLDAGYQYPAVLDISSEALAQSKERLGNRMPMVEWIEADVTEFLSARKFDVWHDRAVFHFLTEDAQRAKYRDALKNSLSIGGKVILATFSLQGPQQCSGLNVMRYDASSLAREVGEGFELERSMQCTHVTPWGKEQDFIFSLFQRV